MEQESTAYWKNLETVTRSTIDQREISSLRIPGLTVLAHADPGRIGERAALTALASGEEVLLSRLEPVFAIPGEPRRRALADPHLSRRPLRLIPVPAGGIRLLVKGSKTRAEADGNPIDGWQEFSADEIAKGVVLLLADKVALLLHTLSPALPQVPRFGLVGESDAIVTVRQQIARVADLDVPAMLRGETGTGKELVARAIHHASARGSRPFVAVNMGAIPPTLAAAELFGATKGAFTGADRKRSGYFRSARGGTLFLDEIGETPSEVQAMLLRTLETGIVQPVGSDESSKVDVRILAATDARLESEIEAGRFRAPLLHRLSGYEIRLPPLRERRDDFGRLLVHFLRLELEPLGEVQCLDATEPGKRPWLPAPLVARLAMHLWPGNVRQLRNVARQLVIDNREASQLRITEQIETMLEETAPIPLAHVVHAPPESEPKPQEALRPSAKESAAESAKPIYRSPGDVSEDELLAVLRANAFRLQPTAAALAISRTSLYALIDRSPNIRKARDLGSEEIERARRRNDGDLDAMAAELEVSRKGLSRRMTQLGLG